VERRPDEANLALKRAPRELERSGPVFDRARRLAGALFGGDENNADIVLVHEDQVWRLVRQSVGGEYPGTYGDTVQQIEDPDLSVVPHI